MLDTQRPVGHVNENPPTECSMCYHKLGSLFVAGIVLDDVSCPRTMLSLCVTCHKHLGAGLGDNRGVIFSINRVANTYTRLW